MQRLLQSFSGSCVLNAIDARIIKRLPAVKDSPGFQLNLHLQTGDGICLVLGPSGSGKTLLLNCLGGFTRPDEGRITVNDTLYFDAAANVFLPPERRRCGYIFQDHALFPHDRKGESENSPLCGPMPTAAVAISTGKSANCSKASAWSSWAVSRTTGAAFRRSKAASSLAQSLPPNLDSYCSTSPIPRGLDSALRKDFYSLLRSLRERWRIPTVLVSHDAARGSK